MEIRQFEQADLEPLLYVWEEASRVGHPFLSKEFLISERENIPKVYIPNGEVWVAVEAGLIKGFLILHGKEVGALFVNPIFHGRGIGFALMNKAAEMHLELNVEVFKENSIGNDFYSKYGFQPVSEYLHEETNMMMLRLKYRKDS